MELVVLIGLQASGKTSFYRERFAGSHVLVSKDLLRSARSRETRQRELIREALSAGRSVVVDNTNARVEDRAPLVALGRAYGACVVGYWFDAELRECLARNAAREGRGRVKDVALYVTGHRLQPPSPAEGFEALYSVRLRPGEGFVVTAWGEPRPEVR